MRQMQTGLEGLRCRNSRKSGGQVGWMNFDASKDLHRREAQSQDVDRVGTRSPTSEVGKQSSKALQREAIGSPARQAHTSIALFPFPHDAKERWVFWV